MIDTLGTALSAAAALAVILGAILLIGRVVRTLPFARPAIAGKDLVPRDSLALDARRRLHLIRVGDRSVLLLTGGETDIVVGWLDERNLS